MTPNPRSNYINMEGAVAPLGNSSCSFGSFFGKQKIQFNSLREKKPRNLDKPLPYQKILLCRSVYPRSIVASTGLPLARLSVGWACREMLGERTNITTCNGAKNKDVGGSGSAFV